MSNEKQYIQSLGELASTCAGAAEICKSEGLEQAAALLKSLEPRPITEAPRDGTEIIIYHKELLTSLTEARFCNRAKVFVTLEDGMEVCIDETTFIEKEAITKLFEGVA